MHVGGIFSESQMLLDSVNHEIFVAILHLSDIHWFMLHVTNRNQTVEIKQSEATQNFFPKWGALKHVVPPSVNSRNFAVYIKHKWPFPENKVLTREHNIC
jgi:hypothetical protein